MKRQIYLTALSTVTVLVILFSILGQNGILPGMFGGSAAGKEADTLYFDAFSSIDIDASVAEFNLEYTDNNTYGIRYEVSSQKLIPSAELKDGTLFVRQAKTKTNNTRKYNSTLTLLIPSGTTIDNLALDMGVGDIELAGLTANKMDLHVGVGDIEMNDSTVATVVLEAGVGDIEMSGCSVTSLDISAGVGDVDLSVTDSLDNYDMDITVGMGTLTVNGAEKNGFGKEYTQTGSGEHKYNISAGTGDVKIAGE